MNDEQLAVWEAAMLLIDKGACDGMKDAVQQAADAYRLLTGRTGLAPSVPLVDAEEWRAASRALLEAQAKQKAAEAELANDPLQRQALAAQARILCLRLEEFDARQATLRAQKDGA